MSTLADPVHVAYVRRVLTQNADRIAASIQPSRPGALMPEGGEFVRWLDKLLTHHQQLCQQEFDRSGASRHRYTGD